MMPALTLNTMEAALQTAMERRTIQRLGRLALTIAPALATATVLAMPVRRGPHDGDHSDPVYLNLVWSFAGIVAANIDKTRGLYYCFTSQEQV